ncbi:MAG: 30S ribosomal protein S1, partial [bacterium]
DRRGQRRKQLGRDDAIRPTGGVTVMEAHFNEPEIGDVLIGRVAEVSKDGTLMDIGAKQDALLPEHEIGRSGKKARLNEEFKVKVIKRNDSTDQFIVSRRMVEQESLWDDLQKDLSEGTVRQGKIVKAVDKGLIVDIGCRAFMPQTHVDTKPVKNLEEWVGREVSVKVIEVNPDRGRAVVSRKAIISQEEKEARKAAFGEIAVGSVCNGRITKVTNFGAFVDIGNGIEGLLHASEISWERVVDATKVLKAGEQVEVKILRKDPETGKLALSRKAILQNPWEAAASVISPGGTVTGTVVSHTKYGAFVKVADGVEGLIHISEMSDSRVNLPSDVVKVGDQVQCRVLEFSPKNKRLKLSIKAPAEAAVQETEQYYQPTNGQVTLGDLLKKANKGLS